MLFPLLGGDLFQRERLTEDMAGVRVYECAGTNTRTQREREKAGRGGGGELRKRRVRDGREWGSGRENGGRGERHRENE